MDIYEQRKSNYWFTNITGCSESRTPCWLLLLRFCSDLLTVSNESKYKNVKSTKK